MHTVTPISEGTGDQKADKPASKIRYVTDFKQVEWFKWNPDHCYSRRFANLLDQLADRLPYHVISVQMVARVLECLPTLPNEKSNSVKRVKQSVSAARAHLRKLDGGKERALIVSPGGYRATVDAEDKSKNAIPSVAKRADRANIVMAQMVSSVNTKEIPDTAENKQVIAEMKIYGLYVNAVEKKRTETQKLLEAIKRTKL
jgi:hypothetical protein